jgi:hypothetical protein
MVFASSNVVVVVTTSWEDIVSGGADRDGCRPSFGGNEEVMNDIEGNINLVDYLNGRVGCSGGMPLAAIAHCCRGRDWPAPAPMALRPILLAAKVAVGNLTCYLDWRMQRSHGMTRPWTREAG